MKMLFIGVMLMHMLTVKLQNKEQKWLGIPFDCQLTAISNIPVKHHIQICQFPFDNDDEDQTIFIVQNLVFGEFERFIKTGDPKIISDFRYWKQGYTIKENDFLYRFTSNNEFHYYYLFKPKNLVRTFEQ